MTCQILSLNYFIPLVLQALEIESEWHSTTVDLSSIRGLPPSMSSSWSSPSLVSRPSFPKGCLTAGTRVLLAGLSCPDSNACLYHFSIVTCVLSVQRLTVAPSFHKQLPRSTRRFRAVSYGPEPWAYLYPVDIDSAYTNSVSELAAEVSRLRKKLAEAQLEKELQNKAMAYPAKGLRAGNHGSNEYIEVFYLWQRRHVSLGNVSTAEYWKKFSRRQGAV